MATNNTTQSLKRRLTDITNDFANSTIHSNNTSSMDDNNDKNNNNKKLNYQNSIKLSIQSLKYRTIDFMTELKFSEWKDDQNPGDLIDRGGYGTVYKGTYINGESQPITVAIKQLEIDQTHLRRRFLKEVAMLAQQSERTGCIQLYGACEVDSNAYIVMEYMKDGDLHKFIEKGGFENLPNWEAKWNLMKSLALAVRRLHSINCKHRDLKPSNLLMHYDETKQWTVKVCDLGCSEALWTHSTENAPTVDSKKRVGTVAYMAPEWLNGTAVTYEFSMDIYSLAMCYYHMIFQITPWGGRQAESILRANEQHKVPPLTGLEEKVPSPWEFHIKRLLTYCSDINPDARPTAAQLVKWFDAGLETLKVEDRIKAVLDEVRTSWGAAEAAVVQLIEADLPLTSDQVHRILAAHLYYDYESKGEFAKKWRLPAFSGNNQFQQQYRSFPSAFYTKYYHHITDKQLEDQFLERAPKVNRINQVKQLPAYLLPNEDVESVRFEESPSAISSNLVSQDSVYY
jgi:serine/threonine protein kinase